MQPAALDAEALNNKNKLKNKNKRLKRKPQSRAAAPTDR